MPNLMLTFKIFCYLFFHFHSSSLCCYFWLQTSMRKASRVVWLFQSFQVLYIRYVHLLSYVKLYQFHDKSHLITFVTRMECEYVNDLHT